MSKHRDWKSSIFFAFPEKERTFDVLCQDIIILKVKKKCNKCVKMSTVASNTTSGLWEEKLARIRQKLLKEVERIKNEDVNERTIIGFPRTLQYFAVKSPRKDYHSLNDVILRYMGIILDVQKRCETEHLKEVFDSILPELTELCAMIAINTENAPFLLQFFSIWSEIVSGTAKNIQRHTGLSKVSALINICETIFKTGHFHTQLNGLELFLRYIEACERKEKQKVLKKIIPSPDFQKIRDLLYNIDISNFEFDGRNFLNEFNMIISEEEPVYSIAVEKGYIDEKPIIKPMHEAKECVLWVDFNSATESVSFYCHSTTFFPNGEKWTNIEVKYPTQINIERGACEFHVLANTDNIEVYPFTTRHIFLGTKIVFRFTYAEKDLSNLQRVISCYNLKRKNKNNVSVYSESGRFYTGFKTINTNQETKWLAPNLPLSKIETKTTKRFENLTWENFHQNEPEIIPALINKNQKDVLALMSDISSVQNISTDNKKLSTEEIVSTSDASKINIQRTISTEKTNNNSNADIAVPKYSKVYTETNKKDKITKGVGNVSAHKKIDEMNNRMPFKEMTNKASGSQMAKKSNIKTIVHDNATKSGKYEISTVKYENREMNYVANGSHLADKSHTKTVVPDNQETINTKRNQNPNTNNSDKVDIETVENEYCTQNVNPEKSGQAKIEIISCYKIPNNTNLKNDLQISISQNTSELNLNSEIIPQIKNSDCILKESGPEENTEKVIDVEKSCERPKPSKKRKLYTSVSEVHISSQLSKDSQLQRRKYLQQRRKTENRNSLKLVNLVKPLELSERDEVKDENLNGINAKITGNEEKVQEVVEEYVNNKGYVGIKASLKCPGVADKFTPQQKEVIDNNLKKLNSIFVNSAKKFFKNESTLPAKQLDVYNERNVEDAPTPSKKERKRKVKEKISLPIKINSVPRYVGTNAKVSHSYRRSKCNNFVNTKTVLTTKEDATSFDKLKQTKDDDTNCDKLKQGVNSNTTSKPCEPVNVAGVLNNNQSESLNKNINDEKSEGSIINIDSMSTTAPAEITVIKIITPRETLNSKSSNNSQEENNTRNLNLLSNQAVHGENPTQPSIRIYTIEDNLTESFVRNEARNNNFIKTITLSPEIELCNSAMANQSMVPNVSFETKDSSGNRHEAKQKNNFEKQPLKRDYVQNDSPKPISVNSSVRYNRAKLTEAKPGKYTSYGQNLDRSPDQTLDRTNYPSSTITPLQELNATMKVDSNWLLEKYLNSISDQNNFNMAMRSSSGVPITKTGQTSCELYFQGNGEEYWLNNFEDDNVDLDSYCSHESHYYIGNEEDNHLKNKKNVGNTTKKHLTEAINLEFQLRGSQRNESLEKRKSSDDESREIVAYKRVRTETIMEYNGTGIRDEILSNLRRKLHQFSANTISTIRNNSDCEEIKARLINQLSTFLISCERHNLQSFESWKQIQKLLAQICKEKERFHLESFAVFNQFSRVQEALAELKNISKAKEAEKIDQFAEVRSNMKETVAKVAKSEWETYIDNLTSNIVKNIQKHIDFDLEL